MISVTEISNGHRDVLDLLRQFLEDGKVTIVRAAMSSTWPAGETKNHNK